MDFSGKRIVVTGAGSGIGAEAARLFLAAGAQVIAVQNTAPAPHASLRLAMNLHDAGSIDEACAALPDGIDHICAIAGLGADRNTPEDIIDINFLGTRHFIEGALPKVRKTGSIVTTASAAARYWRRDMAEVKAILAMRDRSEILPFWTSLAREHQASYHLAKATLVVWTMQQANAHAADGPRFNIVSPGFTATPMLERAFADSNQSTGGLAKLGTRIATAEEVAQMYLLLCSDMAGVLNGADIAADAGLMARFNAREYEF